MNFGLVIVIVASIIAFYHFVDLVFRHQREMKGGGNQMQEIEALKERVRVLERITIEDGNSLAAEIAALEGRSKPDLLHVDRSRKSTEA